jgi:hypothetical protein
MIISTGGAGMELFSRTEQLISNKVDELILPIFAKINEYSSSVK